MIASANFRSKKTAYGAGYFKQRHAQQIFNQSAVGSDAFAAGLHMTENAITAEKVNIFKVVLIFMKINAKFQYVRYMPQVLMKESKTTL